MPTAEKLLLNCASEPHTVYRYLGDDFGEAYELSQETGTRHISVTLDPEGKPPCFPCPITLFTKDPL